MKPAESILVAVARDLPGVAPAGGPHLLGVFPVLAAGHHLLMPMAFLRHGEALKHGEMTDVIDRPAEPSVHEPARCSPRNP